MLEKSRPLAFQCSMAFLGSSTSARPTISLIVRKPSWAMISRTSCAMKRMKLTTCSGSPVKFLRRLRDPAWRRRPGRCCRWQTRIMMQPSATSGAVAKPNSSAPSSAAIDHVAAGLQLAVGLDGDAAAQIVQHERLVRFGQAEFPRDAGVLDAGLAARRRCRRRSR